MPRSYATLVTDQWSVSQPLQCTASTCVASRLGSLFEAVSIFSFQLVLAHYTKRYVNIVDASPEIEERFRNTRCIIYHMKRPPCEIVKEDWQGKALK